MRYHPVPPIVALGVDWAQGRHGRGPDKKGHNGTVITTHEICAANDVRETRNGSTDTQTDPSNLAMAVRAPECHRWGSVSPTSVGPRCDREGRAIDRLPRAAWPIPLYPPTATAFWIILCREI